MTEELKLRECPFCGGEGAIEKHVDVLGVISWFVECGNLIDCDVGVETDGFFTMQEAIKAWNKRVKMTEELTTEKAQSITDSIPSSYWQSDSATITKAGFLDALMQLVVTNSNKMSIDFTGVECD